MWSKEEAKELKINFWNGFKRYCSKHKIYRKWVLTGVKIKSTQLNFYADEQKALVLFQIYTIPRTGIKYMLSSLKKCRYWNKLTGNTAI